MGYRVKKLKRRIKKNIIGILLLGLLCLSGCGNKMDSPVLPVEPEQVNETAKSETKEEARAETEAVVKTSEEASEKSAEESSKESSEAASKATSEEPVEQSTVQPVAATENRSIAGTTSPIPSEEPVQPSEEPTQPSEEPVQPSEEPTQPSEEPVQPSEEPVQPSEEPVQPSEEPTQSSEEPVQPSEEPSQPSEPEIRPYADVVSGYELLFADEFDADSVNADIWRSRTGGTNREENNVITKAEGEEDGCLQILYQKEVTEEGETWTAGGILTRQQFGYGYYEAKGTLYTEGNGLHSSFWLMGGSDIYKENIEPRANTVFEIDIFEFDSNKPTIYQRNLNYKIGEKRGNGMKTEITDEEGNVISMAGREAVFGLEWMPDRITWYLDGQEVRTVTDDEEEFHYAQQSIWLTALAGYSASGAADSDTPEGATSFDYVRYFAKPLKGVNLLGSSEFEYNENVGFTEESKVDLQTPLSFFEENDVECSKIEKSTSAYGGQYVLAHRGEGTDYQVSTMQKLYHIPNASYELTAYVRSSGGQAKAQIQVEDYGGEVLTVDIPASLEQWQKVTIPLIEVTSNEAVISIISDASAEQWLQVDNISFHALEGEETAFAKYYENKRLADTVLSGGEYYANARNANNANSGITLYANGSILKLNGGGNTVSWRASGAVPGPTVNGKASTSIWREPADEDDYIRFSITVPASGRYQIEWFNPGTDANPVCPGTLTLYKKEYETYEENGIQLTREILTEIKAYHTGIDRNGSVISPGWQQLEDFAAQEGAEYIMLTAGEELVAEFGIPRPYTPPVDPSQEVSGGDAQVSGGDAADTAGTRSRIMLRAGALRLYQPQTVYLKDCIVLNTAQNAAFVYGVRNTVNSVPRPVIQNGTCFLPLDWITEKVSLSEETFAEYTKTQINGINYLTAEDFMAATGLGVSVIGEQFAIISPQGTGVAAAMTEILKDCFGEGE